MDLTDTQIQQVVNYFNLKNFNYVDLKDEIIDHMICDIEDLLNKNISFENAFNLTVLKWEMHFKETFSLFLGLLYSDARIVIKKAINIFKPYFYANLVIYFLPILILKNSSFKVQENTINLINNLVVLFTLLAIVYILIIAFKVFKTKNKTTYSFILNTQYLAIVSLIVVFLIGNIVDIKGCISPTVTSFLCTGYFLVFVCFRFYKKHMQAISKYQIW